MAHGSYSSQDDKSLEQGYQEDNVNIATLIKFLIGLAVFTVISMTLMYGLKVVLEAQADAEDKATANPMAYSQEDITAGKNLPPEPRVQGAPGFGVMGPDGKWISLENKAPQAEYWELKKQWDAALQKGMKDSKTGTVIATPIAEAMKEYLAKNPPVRAGATEAENTVAASDTSAGRTPGATPHAETHKEGAEKKEGEAKPSASPQASPSASPQAKPTVKAAGAH